MSAVTERIKLGSQSTTVLKNRGAELLCSLFCKRIKTVLHRAKAATFSTRTKWQVLDNNVKKIFYK